VTGPAHPLETILPGEAAGTERLLARLRRMMVARDADGLQRRDVHVKSHGVMRAEFTVEPELSQELRVGVFAQPATYRAWVRYSSAANAIKPDGARDIRGMAIKVMGVAGRKILEGHED
jgi:catalase